MSYKTDLMLGVHPLAVGFKREDDIGGDKHEQSARKLLSPFHALAEGIRGTEFALDPKTRQIKAVPLSNRTRVAKAVVGAVGALLATATVVPLVKGIMELKRSESYDVLWEKHWLLFHLNQIAQGTLPEEEQILFSHYLEKGLTNLSVEEFVGCFKGQFPQEARSVILRHLAKPKNHDTFVEFTKHLTLRSAAAFATDCQCLEEVTELIRALLSSKNKKEFFSEMARGLVTSLTDEQTEKERALTLSFLERLETPLGGPNTLKKAIFDGQFYNAVTLRHLAQAEDLPAEVRKEALKRSGQP